MGTGEGRARSRSWFFTEKLVNGLMERSGRFWGRFIWGRISLWWSCVNCGGGDCSPGSGWLAGPMVCRRPPCAALVLGSRLGPGSPASVYTSVGDSEGSAAPQLAAPAGLETQDLSYSSITISKPYLMSVIENNIEFISCLFNVLDFTKSFFVHDSLFKLLHGSFIALGLGPLVL